MSVNGLPEDRAIWKVLWSVLLIGLGFGAAMYFGKPRLSLIPPPQVQEKVDLSILRSEQLAFLVARRTVTQVVIQHHEESWSGWWEGVLWATVSWRWGVDLRKLKDSNIRRQGDVYVVTLPGPELLDFGIEPGSVGFMAKATAVPKLADILQNGSQRKLLEDRLTEHTMKFAAQEGLLPTRPEIVRQLNDAASALGGQGNLKIRFE